MTTLLNDPVSANRSPAEIREMNERIRNAIAVYKANKVVFEETIYNENGIPE